MSKIIHMRGDVTGMLVLFVLAFLGAWQVAVAVFRLNGLSLTGYPDRPCWSKIIGAVLIAGSCAWYFSRPGHFAAPDVEGIETLILLVAGLVLATAAQMVLAGAAGLLWLRNVVATPEVAPGETLAFEATGMRIAASFRAGAGGGVSAGARAGAAPVLLLHDYGGSGDDLSVLASGLAAAGHSTLTFDLDGHGDTRLGIASPAMEDLLDAAASALMNVAGGEAMVVVGVGLGGNLAIDLVRRGVAERAVAIDPPARDEAGYAMVNSMRELGPLDVAAAFLRPPARGTNGKPLALARLIREMPLPGTLPEGKLTVIGTAGTWFNTPEALASSAARSGSSEPLPVQGNHATIAVRDDTVAAVINAARS